MVYQITARLRRYGKWSGMDTTNIYAGINVTTMRKAVDPCPPIAIVGPGSLRGNVTGLLALARASVADFNAAPGW